MSDPLGRVVIEGSGPSAIARIVGEVDMSNVAEIERALNVALREARAVYVIDLSQTSFIDSAGIRALFAIATRLRERRGSLHVVVPPAGLLRRVVDLVNLAHVAEIHDTLATVPPVPGTDGQRNGRLRS